MSVWEYFVWVWVWCGWRGGDRHPAGEMDHPNVVLAEGVPVVFCVCVGGGGGDFCGFFCCLFVSAAPVNWQRGCCSQHGGGGQLPPPLLWPAPCLCPLAQQGRLAARVLPPQLSLHHTLNAVQPHSSLSVLASEPPAAPCRVGCRRREGGVGLWPWSGWCVIGWLAGWLID